MLLQIEKSCFEVKKGRESSKIVFETSSPGIEEIGRQEDNNSIC